MGRIDPPAPKEYADYYGRYVALVSGRDILACLADELNETRQVLGRVPPELESHRYDEGKWTVRDIVGHLIDTERVFAYRAMSFARGDVGPLPGMDQDEWARTAQADATPLPDLSREFAQVRASTIALFSRLDSTALAQTGLASGVEFTVRALAYIIAGHEIHHRTILEERYRLADL